VRCVIATRHACILQSTQVKVWHDCRTLSIVPVNGEIRIHPQPEFTAKFNDNNNGSEDLPTKRRDPNCEFGYDVTLLPAQSSLRLTRAWYDSNTLLNISEHNVIEMESQPSQRQEYTRCPSWPGKLVCSSSSHSPDHWAFIIIIRRDGRLMWLTESPRELQASSQLNGRTRWDLDTRGPNWAQVSTAPRRSMAVTRIPLPSHRHPDACHGPQGYSHTDAQPRQSTKPFLSIK